MQGAASSSRGRNLEAAERLRGVDPDQPLPEPDLETWGQRMRPAVPPSPRRVVLGRPPVAILVGACALLIWGGMAAFRGQVQVHRSDWGGLGAVLLVLAIPAAIWGIKLRREFQILRYGDACFGEIIGVRTGFRSSQYAILAYRTNAGAAYEAQKLDWWQRQQQGRAAFVFVSPSDPTRCVLQGCCAFEVAGLDGIVEDQAPELR